MVNYLITYLMFEEIDDLYTKQFFSEHVSKNSYIGELKKLKKNKLITQVKGYELKP